VDYALVKAIHVGAVALSFCGFVARGIGALAKARWVRGRIARSLPHVVDTALLASAIALAWTLGLGPTNSAWIAAKTVALLVYIGLGVVALRPQTPPRARAAAWIGAIVVFCYIVSVAVTKNPRGWFAAF
jgi:uncharacterized membrane protein SirB2